MHDHTKRGKRFCPLMKEWCNQGWTPSMGYDGDEDDKMPKLGACAAWQPVTLVENETQRTIEILDCALFGWPPDLATELSGKMGVATHHITRTTNEIARQHSTMIAMASPEVKERLMANDPRRKLLPHMEKGSAEHKNENGQS